LRIRIDRQLDQLRFAEQSFGRGRGSNCAPATAATIANPTTQPRFTARIELYRPPASNLESNRQYQN
jgi:hypothetical protein